MTTGSYTYGGGANQDYRFYKSWSGANDPKKRAENAYSCVIQRMSRGKTNRYRPDGTLFDSIYLVRGNYTVPAGPNSEQELACLAKLAEKIRGHDFNGLVFAAEAKQSLDTISNTSSAMSLLVRSAIKRDSRGMIKAIRGIPGQYDASQLKRMLKVGDVSGAVLALRYGWQPLLQDCFEAAKAFEALTAPPRQVTYRAAKFWVYSTQDSAAYPSTGNIPSLQRVDLKYKVVLRENISAARSLGLLNPASVLWEKLPYSFVIDWFIPIGNYLSTVATLTRLQMTYTRSVFRAGYAKSIALPPPLSAGWKNVGGFWNASTVNFARSVGGNPGVPFPTLKSLDRIFGTVHIQNAAALIASNVKSIADFSDRRPRRF